MKKTHLIPLVLFASTALLTGCNQNQTANTSTTPTVAKEDAVAVVNGTYISKATLASLESELEKRQQGQDFPKEKLVEELIQRELLLQEAKQKKLDQTVEYTTQLETIKTGLLTQAAIQNFLKSNPITDADLKAEYDKNVAASGTEYKARHILVKSEDDAKNIITELSNGANFAELAKTKSTGPSGPQGGDLGWFAAGQMVAPFSEAVIALEDNKFTLAPVKTQFGYHIILREGSRAQTPPPFESIKERIRPMLQRQKMQGFLEGLRQQAKVEILLAAPAPAIEATQPAATHSHSDSDSATHTHTADTVTDSAKAVVSDTTSAVTELADKVSSSTSDLAEQAKSAVTEATSTATNTLADKVKEVADVAKTAASDSVEKAEKSVTDKVTNTLDALTK